MPKERPIDWTMTRKVREAVADERVIVPDHFVQRADECFLSLAEAEGLLRTGVVLSRREKDELRTAVDGYKHFLEGVSVPGKLYEIVFKFVWSRKKSREELLILLTVYRGEV